ncbi:MACROD2 isoform 7 [Pongo abelii]|uniref:MACROD2 isoform 7 n=1 Tax=Pongo abelii TaxID=9601 RepID=A0A2J8VD68_PONAB|nr:MACROD2 isoform 7 [Pongo abelii]
MYPSNKKKKVWREEKERLLKMTLEERRKEYLRDYIPLNSILSWKEEMKGKGQNDGPAAHCTESQSEIMFIAKEEDFNLVLQLRRWKIRLRSISLMD